MYDVVIVGSGPAGLAASIYAKRAGLKAITLEKNYMSGGQVLNTYEVDNYPGLPGINGFDMGMKFREHADKLECEFQTAEVLEVKELLVAELQAATYGTKKNGGFVVVTDQGEFETKTVLAAMGASHAKLHIPGEEELSGMGVSYCATCDGAFFKGKVTAVIGGGDVAVEDAIFLARGCSKVYLIHRRDKFRGAEVTVEKVKKEEKIEIIYNDEVKEFSGNENLDKLILKSGKHLTVDGAFIAIGSIPETELFKGVIKLDEKGFIEADDSLMTNLPLVYAAVDVRTKKLRQVVTAQSDGAIAISNILEKK